MKFRFLSTFSLLVLAPLAAHAAPEPTSPALAGEGKSPASKIAKSQKAGVSHDSPATQNSVRGLVLTSPKIEATAPILQPIRQSALPKAQPSAVLPVTSSTPSVVPIPRPTSVITAAKPQVFSISTTFTPGAISSPLAPPVEPVAAPVIEAPTKTPVAVAAKPEIEKTDDEADSKLLARLDRDLSLASRRLTVARGQLSEGQRELSDVNGILQKAILEVGSDAKGLNPFVKVAQRYMGTPYVWGGESARGFDCSGFIIRVMRDLGYRALPHSAAEQFRYGVPVAQGLLKPGDLVFFANTYKPGISHVGIYLGKRRFIHAANSKIGTVVSSLDDAKHRAKYAGARRLMPTRG